MGANLKEVMLRKFIIDSNLQIAKKFEDSVKSSIIFIKSNDS